MKAALITPLLVSAVTMLTALALSGPAFANIAERWLIYPLDRTEVAPQTTGLAGVRAQTLQSGNANLIVWTAPPRPGQPIVLYFHGNAGNLAMRAARFHHFLSLGYGLIAPAYRGSSGSSGTPSETALRRDAMLVWQAMADLLPTTTPDQVVVYGESLGSAVAVHLLADIGGTSASDTIQAPAALILEAPFTSIRALAERHYPKLAPLAGNLVNRWNTLGHATTLQLPLLVLHGAQDRLIPAEMGRQIFSAAPSQNKDFIHVDGAGHSDLWRPDTLPRIKGFIETYLVR